MEKSAKIVKEDEQFTSIQKMDFESVDAVFGVLFDVFHPDGIDDESPDIRFVALWTMFLISVGWSEPEYWKEYESRENLCQKCGGHIDEPEEGGTPPISKAN